MMAEQTQIWQGTIWTGLTSEDGERMNPELLPWADPYIAALVEKHRWQAVLFALQPDTEDEAFWDDEVLDDPVPTPPADRRVGEDWPALAPLAPFSPDEATDEFYSPGPRTSPLDPAWARGDSLEEDRRVRAAFLQNVVLPQHDQHRAAEDRSST
jgi:hypothetical protein